MTTLQISDFEVQYILELLRDLSKVYPQHFIVDFTATTIKIGRRMQRIPHPTTDDITFIDETWEAVLDFIACVDLSIGFHPSLTELLEAVLQEATG